jgi:ADP-heptose:LPS heptosyltransferase
VLVIFPGALGDLICLGPALRVLARRHGCASIELMAKEELALFAVRRMAVGRGHSIDRREVSLLFTDTEDAVGKARRFFGMFHRIYSFFAADDPGFRRALGRVACGDASFHPFRPHGCGHVARLYLRSIGADDGLSLDGRIQVTREDADDASRVLASAGIGERPFVLVHPGSGSPAKNWPMEQFIDVARHLAATGETVLFVAGPAEERLGEQIRRARFPVAEGLELGTLAGLAARAEVFVGNDSGATHLAAAAGAPTVAIFGPTDAQRWRPLGRVLVLERMPLESLAPEEVAAAIRRMS